MTKATSSVSVRRRFMPSTPCQLTLPTAGVVFLVAIVLLGTMTPRLTVAVRQPDASPVATEANVTPIATPQISAETRCSVVLGTGEDGDACVAFVQAIPALDPVDLTLGESDDTTATDVAFGNYVDFDVVSVDRDLSVRITDSASPDLLIVDASLDLQPDIAYVVVLEQAYDGDGPTLTAVPIDLTPLGPEESRLAFHHAVTDAAQLSVLGLESPSDEEIVPGKTTDQITVEAGSFAVEVVPGNEPTEVLATLDLQLEPGLSYLVIVGGTTGDQSVQVLYAAAPVGTAP